MYKNKIAPKWLEEAAKIAEDSARFGKRVEKFTGGIIKTHSMVLTHSAITKEELLQPLLLIRIEMVNAQKCKNIGDLIEMLKSEGIIFTHAGHYGLEEIYNRYIVNVLKIKNLIIEILGKRTTARKEVEDT